MSEAFVTIATFDRPEQAAVLQAELERHEIEVLVRDSLTTGLLGPFQGGSVIGVRVDVPREDAEVARALAAPLLDREAQNTGRPVFRVRATKMWGHLLVGAALGLIGAVMIHAFAAAPTWAAVVLAGGAIAGAVLGLTRRDDFCSDCGAGLDANVAICPRCQGNVSGEIGSASERLDALERL